MGSGDEASPLDTPSGNDIEVPYFPKSSIASKQDRLDFWSVVVAGQGIGNRTKATALSRREL